VAVDDVDLDVFPGEVVGLLGPNGSGKSTTLNMVLGYIRPTAGTVEIAGYDLATHRLAALASVGGLVEGSAFYPYLSGRANLELIARLRRLAPSRVEEVLAMVDMLRPADRDFAGYSLGMRQRLAVAAALVHDPQVVVLDEPTSGLDPAGTREMRGLIPALASAGHTIILASHLMNEVQQVCQRVAIMKEGRIIARGEVADLLHDDGAHLIGVAAQDLEDARTTLEAAEGVGRVTLVEDGLLVQASVGGEALNRALVAAGIYADRIEPASRSLEEAFLELTEKVGPR